MTGHFGTDRKTPLGATAVPIARPNDGRLAPDGSLRHNEEPPPAPRGRIPKALTPKARMAR